MMLIEQKSLICSAAHEDAVALLRSDLRQNALLLGRLLNGFAEDVGVYQNSVRLRDTRSGNYMFSVESLEAFDRLYGEARDRPKVFFLSDDRLLHEMEGRGYGVDTLHQWLIGHDAEMGPADPAFSFGPTRLSDLDIIMSVYKSREFGRDYVADIIRDNPSASAYDGERMAAFVLSHKDGEAGPMVVLDQYRRRGLGTRLLRHITNLMRHSGLDPVCHIHPANDASRRMHAEVGYTPCPNPVLWIYPGNAI